MDSVRHAQFMCHADAQRLGSIDAFARNPVAAERARTHGADEQRREPHRRHPDPHLGNGEECALGRQHDVAAGRNGGAAADGAAMDHDDGRLGQAAGTTISVTIGSPAKSTVSIIEPRLVVRRVTKYELPMSSATSAPSCATAPPSPPDHQAMLPARPRRAQPRARAISDLPQYKNYTVGQADRQLAVSVPQLAVLTRSRPERPTSAASPAGRKKSAENWSPK